MAMQGSIAVVRAEIDTSRNDGKNCCATENVLTLVKPLCKGCKIMLLDYKVVEGKLQNGSIGEVHDICYKPGEINGAKGSTAICPMQIP